MSSSVPPGDTPPPASASSGSPSSAPPPSAPPPSGSFPRSEGPRGPSLVAPGTILVGTYEILEHLSSGGFGEVYRGCNIHNRHEIVAIKIVLAALAHDEVALSLFQQESSALNRVAHDAIVRYKMFTIDPGLNRPCLVMEFVDGPSLGDRLESGPMPESEVLDLLLRLASGLESAHRTEVVHRDLSPDNVILPDGRIDTAKIIDFGIAKMTTPGGRTLIGDKFAGKPGYVAPEQLGAFGGIVTGQADVYSLALVAAAAARGHPLDMGDSVVAAVHSRQRVPDLSGVPEGLRGLLGSMLQPDPADRPAGMGAVIAAVLRLQGVEPALSRGPVTMPPVAGVVGRVSNRPQEQRLPTVLGPGLPLSGDLPMPPPPPPSPPPAAKRSRTGLLVAVLAVLVLAGGGGAWYAGLIGTPSPATPIEQIDWLERHIAGTPGTDLCRHIQIRALPQPPGQAVAIEVFTRDPSGLAPLSSGFAAASRVTTDLTIRQIAGEQCSLLDFLSAISAPLAGSMSLRLTDLPEQIVPGEDLSGSLAGLGAEQPALLLLDPSGRLQNASSLIGGDAAAFRLPSVRFAPPAGMAAWPEGSQFLLLAMTSETALPMVEGIPGNMRIPADQVSRFWDLLAPDIRSQRRPVRAVLQAIPVAP